MKVKTSAERAAYRFFVMIYIVVITITFYSETNLPKIASMAIIPIAFFVFIVYADFDRFKALCGFPLWMIAGCLLVCAYSLFVWIINIEESIYITTGVTRIGFQIINILVAFSGVYIFGSKAIDYTLYSAFVMNTIIVIRGVLKYGISASISDTIHAITTGEQSGFMSSTEIHVMTYVYGFFIIYYLFISDYTVKRKAVLIGGSVFFILMGFKRIVFASLALSLVLLLIYFKLPQKLKKGYVFFIAITTAVVSFLYIPYIRTGLFEYTMNYLNIETNTRIDIYNYMESTYSFSPSFLGHGVDYVVRYLQYLKTLHIKYSGSSLEYIHNDILVRYIEMGFVGFCGWLYSTCIFCCKWAYNHCGLAIAALYAILNTANFVNFSVGNTNRAYAVRLVLAVIVIGAICKVMIEDKAEKNISLTGGKG